MNKSTMMMHGCGLNFRSMMRMFHARCAPEIMACSGYPVHHKVSPNCELNLGRRNEFVRRTMIFNRYCG